MKSPKKLELNLIIGAIQIIRDTLEGEVVYGTVSPNMGVRRGGQEGALDPPGRPK